MAEDNMEQKATLLCDSCFVQTTLISIQSDDVK